MNRLAVAIAGSVLVVVVCLWLAMGRADGADPEPMTPAARERTGAIAPTTIDEPAAPSRTNAGDAVVIWRLGGRVRAAPDQAPVAGALLTARMDFGSGTDPLVEVRSDGQGMFELDLGALRLLPPLDLGRVAVALAASAEGRGATYARITLPHRDPLLPMRLLHDLELAAAAVVTGRVVTERGTPAVHADVELCPFGAHEQSARKVAQTDDAGRYRLASPVAGSFILRARQERSGLAEGGVDLVLGRDVTAPDLVLRSLHVIAGRVTFEDGEPAAEVEVSLLAEDGKTADAAARPVTDADGRFVAATLLAGRYRPWLGYCLDRAMTAEARGWPLLTTDEPEATLVLKDVHQLRLRYEDEAGRALRHANVSFRAWRSQEAEALRGLRDGVPLPPDVEARRIGLGGGTFRRPILLDRGYWAWVRAGLGDSRGEALVEAAPPRNVLDVVLRLQRRAATATLRVLLKASDGGPVSDFGLHLRQLRLGEPDVWEMNGVRTEQGLLYRVPPGRYLAVVAPKATNADMDFGSFAKFEQTVELHADAETVLDRTVEAGGRVRFCVRLADGTAPRLIDDFVIGTMPGGQWTAGRRNFVRRLRDGWESGSEVRAGEPLVWESLLRAGRHELTVRSRDWQDAVIGVTIAPRAITDVDIWLQPR